MCYFYLNTYITFHIKVKSEYTFGKLLCIKFYKWDFWSIQPKFPKVHYWYKSKLVDLLLKSCSKINTLYLILRLKETLKLNPALVLKVQNSELIFYFSYIYHCWQLCSQTLAQLPDCMNRSCRQRYDFVLALSLLCKNMKKDPIVWNFLFFFF